MNNRTKTNTALLPLLLAVTLAQSVNFGCSQRVTRSAKNAQSASAAVLAEQAETTFRRAPRTDESAHQAYDLAHTAAQMSPKDSPLHYACMIQACRYAIWLSHHASLSSEGTRSASEAVALANQAVALQLRRVEGYYFRALATGLLAQHSKRHGRQAMRRMRSDLTRAGKIDPDFDFGGPDRVLGTLYLRAPGPPAGIGSVRKALFYLRKAHDRAPAYPENVLFLVEALLKAKHFHRARQLLDALPPHIDEYGDPGDRAEWRKREQALREALRQKQVSDEAKIEGALKEPE